MKFTVVWQPAALNKLADLWVQADDQVAVAQAANTIDKQLTQQPQTAGESRQGDLRILICPPLAVYFTVSMQDYLVSVIAVWRWKS